MSNITNHDPDVSLPDAYDMTVGTISIGHQPPMPRISRLSDAHADREGGPLDTYLFLAPTDENFREQALDYLGDHLDETSFTVKPAGGTYYSPETRHWDWFSPDDADEDDPRTRFRSVVVQEPAGSNIKTLTEHTYTLSVVAKPLAEEAVAARNTLGRGASHLTIPWDEEAAPDEDPPIHEALKWDDTPDLETETLNIESNHVPLTKVFGRKWDYEASWIFPIFGGQDSGKTPMLSKTGNPNERHFEAEVEAFVDCRVYTNQWTAQSDSEVDTEEDYEVGEELLEAERRDALEKALKSGESTKMVLRSGSRVGSDLSQASEDPLEAERIKFLSKAGRTNSGGTRMTLRRRATENDKTSKAGGGLLVPEAEPSGSSSAMTLRSGATVGGEILREEPLPAKKKKGKKDRVNTS
ncbi:hypothetical protein IAT38_004892 [Cryptococcus sp. DSM 104549]